MKTRNIIHSSALIALSALTFSACNDFLDEMPDNRATLDNEDKITNMLVSAYTTNTPNLVMEYMSDNVNDEGENNPYTDRFYDQTFYWEDITENDNESPESFYDASYQAIASANAALEAIEDLGGATTAKLQAAKGEALIARAYNHFMLVNFFCKPYNSETSTKDLGLPYAEKSETTLRPEYERGTVAEAYAKMEKDIEEGLPLVSDEFMTVPKYHFNQKAAYAFAARFYLYYEKWDKCIEYATKALGSDPASVLRDYVAIKNATQSYEAITQMYIAADENANLLLLTGSSNLGLIFGPYYVGARYSHDSYIGMHETAGVNQVWGSAGLIINGIKEYEATNLNKFVFWRYPYLFEYTDPVAGIGYRHTVTPALTTDETLLNRAEAYAILKQYDNAIADLNTWMHNFTSSKVVLTQDVINNFYNAATYSYEDADKKIGTVKKHINPHFAIDAEGSDQENLLQCVLSFKRLEELHGGLRWNDVRRYRIVIPRIVMNASTQPDKVVDWLQTDDPRYAIQLPKKVIDAGMEKNPR